MCHFYFFEMQIYSHKKFQGYIYVIYNTYSIYKINLNSGFLCVGVSFASFVVPLVFLQCTSVILVEKYM